MTTVPDGPARVPADGESALRVLLSASEEIESLRQGGLEAAAARGLILRVANAVDRSLRRLLRDQEGADLSLRLKALAPDELRTDAVLAELRRCERLPVELAAVVHELFEVRRRLEGGWEPGDADRTRAVRAADQLLREIEHPRPIPRTLPDTTIEQAFDDDLGVSPVPSRHRRPGPVPVWAIAGLAIVLLVAGGIWVVGRDDGSPGIAEGITLFRSGDYAEASQHFWRYAEANPRDPTPHLYLARIHRRMSRPALAADAIRAAEALAPEDAAVHRELGFLLLDTGRADVAVDRFRKAIELDGESSEGWVGLVRALRETGRADEADRAIAGAPAEVRALFAQPTAPL